MNKYFDHVSCKILCFHAIVFRILFNIGRHNNKVITNPFDRSTYMYKFDTIYFL